MCKEISAQQNSVQKQFLAKKYWLRKICWPKNPFGTQDFLHTFFGAKFVFRANFFWPLKCSGKKNVTKQFTMPKFGLSANLYICIPLLLPAS